MKKATSACDNEFSSDETLEPVRSSIQTAVDSYVSSKFVCENAAASVFTKDGNIVVLIVGEKPNLRNFWSGKWSSTWSVSISGSSASVTGDIKIHAHYFEDGNVQMQSAKSIPSTDIQFSDQSQLSSKLISLIKVSLIYDCYKSMNLISV